MIGKRSAWPAGVVLFGLAGVLAFTTFQWGGVVRAGRYEYLLVVGLLASWAGVSGSSKKKGLYLSRAVRWTVALLPAYLLFQVIPLPVSMLSVLSPARAAGVAALGPIGAGIRLAPLSAFPAGTFQYFLLVCAYIVIFLLARQLTLDFRKRLWLLVWPVIGIAALEAILGLWQYFGGNGEQDRWGTYANHNHFAGFLEMSFPFAVMYAMVLLHRPHSRFRSSIRPVLMACGVWTLAGIIFTGIVYSFSRMGFISTLFSLLVMGVIAFGTGQLNSVTASRTRQFISIGAVTSLILASFTFIPPDKLIQRFANFVSADGLTDDGRSGLWIETLPLIKAYPVFGCGLGGYETAFSRFKKSGVLVTDDFVHNDYIQLLAELGLLGFAIGVVLAFSVTRIALQRAVKSTEPEARYFAVACLGSLSAIALHSLADFNLYIPANAMLLAWIAGAAVSVEPRQPEVNSQGRLEIRDLHITEPVEIGFRP